MTNAQAQAEHDFAGLAKEFLQYVLSVRAFLRYFNPYELPEAKSQQWAAVSDYTTLRKLDVRMTAALEAAAKQKEEHERRLTKLHELHHRCLRAAEERGRAEWPSECDMPSGFERLPPGYALVSSNSTLSPPPAEQPRPTPEDYELSGDAPMGEGALEVLREWAAEVDRDKGRKPRPAAEQPRPADDEDCGWPQCGCAPATRCFPAEPPPESERDRALKEWIKRRRDGARKTLALKAREAAKGHDWVVASEVMTCQQLIDVANYALRSRAPDAPPAGETERLREVVEFYADPDTWFATMLVADRPCGEIMEDIDSTEGWEPIASMRPGKRARAALAKQGGE